MGADLKTARDGHEWFDEEKKLYRWRIKVGGSSRTASAKTKREQKVKIAKVLDEINARGAVLTKADREMTVGQWLDFWLAHYVQPNRQYNTWRQYRQIVELYAKPTIGPIRLDRLTSGDCQQMLNALEARGLASATRSTVRTVVKRAFNVAMKQTPPLLLSNPVEGTESPKRSINRKRILPSEAFERLISACLKRSLVTTRKGITEHRCVHRYGPLIAFGLATGLRVAEYNGQTWSDIDMAATPRPCAVVLQKLVWKECGEWEIDAPKSARSCRTIPLADLAQKALEAQRATQAQERRDKGSGYQTSDLVWTTEIGTPIKPRNVQRALDGILQDAGIPHHSLKDLRKAFGTHLARKQVPPHVLQKLLGHESIDTTMRYYVDACMGDMSSAMDAF